MGEALGGEKANPVVSAERARALWTGGRSRPPCVEGGTEAFEFARALGCEIPLFSRVRNNVIQFELLRRSAGAPVREQLPLPGNQVAGLEAEIGVSDVENVMGLGCPENRVAVD